MFGNFQAPVLETGVQFVLRLLLKWWICIFFKPDHLWVPQRAPAWWDLGSDPGPGTLPTIRLFIKPCLVAWKDPGLCTQDDSLNPTPASYALCCLSNSPNPLSLSFSSVINTYLLTMWMKQDCMCFMPSTYWGMHEILAIFVLLLECCTVSWTKSSVPTTWFILLFSCPGFCCSLTLPKAWVQACSLVGSSSTWPLGACCLVRPKKKCFPISCTFIR